MVNFFSRKERCRTADANDEQSQSGRVAYGGTRSLTDVPHAAKSGSRVVGAEVSEKSRKSTSSSTSVTSAVIDFFGLMRASRGSTTRLFGHTVNDIQRSHETGEVMSCAKVDLNRFLRERLVPVEGFACRVPADPKRLSTIKAMTTKLNESLRTQGFVDKRLKVPPEALCRVLLHTVGTFDGNANLLADRAQLVKIGVKIQGALLFPADDQHHDRAKRPNSSIKQDGISASAMTKAVKARTQKGGRKRGNGRFQLGFELHLALERSAEDAHAEDTAVPALQVKVVAMDVPKTQDVGGDAMTDSWLPKDDLLADIEALIDDKLQEAVAETTVEPN